jgi:hypothetical protein
MNRGMRFLQSAFDFPCMVELGWREPSWRIRRWGRDALRFCPVPHDRFAVRGNSRRLLYRGERESHCFTILDGNRFEYDVILKRKPESNTVVLFLEGWEGFDFLRQPDRFGPEPLRGSYAVYKKEPVLNSAKYHVGTGKFCHIYRPKIIDNRGREVWGGLRIDRGILTITIPEKWLGEAAYPVVVDPVIGSNTIGAYRTFPYIDKYNYELYMRDLARYPNDTDIYYYYDDMQLYLEEWMVLNRQTTPLALQGAYNAYLYADETWHYPSGSTTYYEEGYAYPMLYSSLNNKPKQLLLSDTSWMVIKVSPATPAKWNKGTITFGTRINAGTDIWFGFAGDMGIGCRFDYGSQYRGVYGFSPPEDNNYQELGLETVVEYITDCGYADVSGKTDYLCDSGNDSYNRYPGARFDFKISMYLELPPQQYTRTVTQGVKLADSGKRVHGIVQKLLQTAGVSQTNRRVQEAIRKAAETAAVIEPYPGTYRDIRRTAADTAYPASGNGHTAEYHRTAADGLSGTGEALRRGEYCRKQEDTAYSEAVSLRHLLVFIRLITGSFIRDYLIGRFLKSREEAIIKSAVCRELTLDSRLH